MIPESLHILVRLRSGLHVIGTAYLSLVILVESKNQMQLVVGVGITQFQCIMVASGYIPIQSAQNAFVIIRKGSDGLIVQRSFYRNSV